ncbi:MAG: TIGR03905 family TSCPD domain-containing protein [Clostridia bacterium]|nr:TIGR03905 family TSCPD domain-containing protein [Clostridia bacterium]
MAYRFPTRGVCARSVSFDLKDGHVYNVQFEGGCNGNTKGVGVLIDGMDAREAIRRLSGIRCGFKATSCPDQLAQALQQAINE